MLIQKERWRAYKKKCRRVYDHTKTVGSVTICDNVFISEYATILKKATVAKGSSVVCHRVVTKDVLEYAIVTDNLAKVVENGRRVIRTAKIGIDRVENRLILLLFVLRDINKLINRESQNET